MKAILDYIVTLIGTILMAAATIVFMLLCIPAAPIMVLLHMFEGGDDDGKQE